MSKVTLHMRTPLPLSRYLFPNPMEADPEGEGLVAIGADLAPETILEAYHHGIFPWFAKGDPICWWSPEPRCIIYPKQFQPSKSLQRQLKKNQYTFTINQAFEQVMRACAAPRSYADDTWIDTQIIQGYTALHHAGYGYSIEVWEGDSIESRLLVGGLYGLQLGRAFFGESMFSRRTDVSKMAFCLLMQLCANSNFAWVDCQLPNDHLMSLGATTMPRADFLKQLFNELDQPPPDWQMVCSQSFSGTDILNPSLFLHLIK